MNQYCSTGDDWWCNSRDAAEYTGLPKSLLFQLAKHGLLRRAKSITSNWALFKKSELDALLAVKTEI